MPHFSSRPVPRGAAGGSAAGGRVSQRRIVGALLALVGALPLLSARPFVRPAVADACTVPLRPDEVAAAGVPAIARELRGAWVSPVEGGEWPSRPDMSAEAQRAELIAVLDRAVALGLNAVVLHVRTAADAMYPTQRAPWSSYLLRAVRSRLAPTYDPLAFAVTEAHRRGLQLHAWFNPFRAATPDARANVGALFLGRSHPEWIVRYGSQTWIDPGYPAARRDVVDGILEVVERYDIDAVHLDDYFYPYLETTTVRRRVGSGRTRRTVVSHETIAFPDDRSWREYGAGFSSRADWRRANVNELVATLYKEVKARKPWVLVGISPFGIWRPGSPRGLTGLDSYSEVYADTRRWLREGWVDYFAPQLYWQLDGEQSRFTRLDAWWRGENLLGRHLWPGLFTMRVASRGAPWPVAEIPAQIRQLRGTRTGSSESEGHFHFRLAAMAPGSPLGVRLTRDSYATAAVPPASPWLGAGAPGAPRVVACAATSDPTLAASVSVPVGVPASPVSPVVAAVPTFGAPGTRPLGARPSGALGTGAMLGTPPEAAFGPVAQIAVGDSAAVRWWVVQLRDAAGAWSLRTVPGNVRTLSLRTPSGERATMAAISALSPSGVASAPTVVRTD